MTHTPTEIQLRQNLKMFREGWDRNKITDSNRYLIPGYTLIQSTSQTSQLLYTVLESMNCIFLNLISVSIYALNVV